MSKYIALLLAALLPLFARAAELPLNLSRIEAS